MASNSHPPDASADAESRPSESGSERGSDSAPLRQAVRELRSSEAFLEAVLDNLPVAVFVKDASDDYRFTFWNKKQEEVTTVRRSEAIGSTDFDLFSEESAQYFREVDEGVVAGGKLVDVPQEILTKEEGKEIWLHTAKVPVKDPQGRDLLIGISEDITHQVKAKEQLERLNANLSRKTAELEATQMQLIQAEKMESVGRLAAGVAHEVKNPLALVLLGVDYLSGGIDPEDPNVPGVLEEMREAVGRADRIIRGLVDFSRERQLALETTEVRPLVEHALLLVRHQVTRGSVRVKTHFDERLPDLNLDAAKFEQVLVNLFINALHAMEGRSGGVLDVSVRGGRLGRVPRDEGARTANHLRSGDEVVVIDVADNGPGIAREHLDKIFEPFFTTKATGKGTGLGLSVVRKIIELHEGTIEIRNRMRQKGVRVLITLKVPSADRSGGSDRPPSGGLRLPKATPIPVPPPISPKGSEEVSAEEA